jgi:hypothetical protein
MLQRISLGSNYEAPIVDNVIYVTCVFDSYLSVECSVCQRCRMEHRIFVKDTEKPGVALVLRPVNVSSKLEWLEQGRVYVKIVKGSEAGT